MDVTILSIEKMEPAQPQSIVIKGLIQPLPPPPKITLNHNMKNAKDFLDNDANLETNNMYLGTYKTNLE